jgi:hypothetical protein
MAENFRYLIPERIYDEIINKVTEAVPYISHGWIFADRRGNFAIVSRYTFENEKVRSKSHKRPRSWMRYKKAKIYNMRKFKQEEGVDIAWEWHSHPSGNEKLHMIDKQILNYLSMGVMIIVTPKLPANDNKGSYVGWYYDKRTTKKPIIEKMVFEIITE